MQIYKLEAEAGLSDKIVSSTTISLASVATNNQIDTAKAVNLYPNDEYRKYLEKYVPADLMQCNAILVSTNWNGNDDVFSPSETWAAVSTPRFKPVNLNHEGREGTANNTIGVMIDSYPVGQDYKYCGTDDNGNPPDNFNILTTAVLWEKYFPEAVKNIKAAIDKGEQYVSMECYFKDFGYAFKPEDSNAIQLLPRNELTAKFTQYLRAYDGKGTVKVDGKNYKIGRWLRSLAFSGMGFVDKPANPNSIVFQDYLSHASQKYTFIEANEKILNDLGTSSVLSISTQKRVALWL